MDETWTTWPAPELPGPPSRLGEQPVTAQDPEPPRSESSPTPSEETDPLARAGSRIEELCRRFIEDVGGLISEAQISAESARAARADAERIRQEAVKLHADAAAAALRIIGAARAEASEIREEARRRLETERSVRGLIDELESLAEALGGIGESIGEWAASEDVVVAPEASGNASAA